MKIKYKSIDIIKLHKLKISISIKWLIYKIRYKIKHGIKIG